MMTRDCQRGSSPKVSAQGLGAALRYVHRLYMRLLQEELSKRGLTVGQYLHLRMLFEEDNIAQNEISSRLGIEKASSTKILDALEADASIVRARDGADRRRLLVKLSPKGRELAMTTMSFAQNVAKVAGRDIAPETMALFLSTVDRLIENLSDQIAASSDQ
jgi:MarR family transcriptional regulator, organic hydroperoxide resistance regulator